MDLHYIKEIVRQINELLVAEKFQELYTRGGVEAMPPNAMKEALEGYGQLTMPPDAAFDEMHIYRTEDPNYANVNLNLWFDNQKSDITLSCSVFALKEKTFSVDDIHML